MDIKTLEEVVKRVENSTLHQVTVSSGNQSITVVNRNSNEPQMTVQSFESSLGSSNTHTKLASNQSTHSQSKSSEQSESFIRSTHVGFVQLGQDDAADALVKAGDSVDVGQTVAYVDVLTKLLPVHSEHSGVVSQVLVANGDKVEYGKPLIELL